VTAYEIDGIEGVFGVPEDHDNDHAPVVAAISCSEPTCNRLNNLVPIHADTVLPVLCGGQKRSHDGLVPCGQVLHCDHDEQEAKETAGTIGQPVEITHTRCRICKTATKPPTMRNLPPVRLEDLPASFLAAFQ
jgi:hypothetical protein